jgi:hypothetical protein
MPGRLRVNSEGPPIHVVVTGSRNWSDEGQVFDDLSLIEASGRLHGIVEGGARGADAAAAAWAKDAQGRGIEWAQFRADWKTHGKKAGALRNRQMLDDALSAVRRGLLPIVLAYPLADSIGTVDMMRVCAAAGLRVVNRGTPVT